MDESDSSNVLSQAKKRVRTSPKSYIGRDLSLNKKYRYGDKIEHEPIKGIQKEIDRMAGLLCAVHSSEEVVDNPDQLLRIYQNKIEELIDLERQVISELPERESDE